MPHYIVACSEGCKSLLTTQCLSRRQIARPVSINLHGVTDHGTWSPHSQSETSILVMWSIRGQYSAHGTWPPHSPLLSLPIITRATAWVADGVPLSFRLFDIDSHFEERVTALNVGSLCIPAIVAVASWDMRRSKDVRDYSRDYDRRSGDKFVVTPSKHSTNSQSQASLSRLGNPSKIPSTSVQNTSYK